MTELYVYAWFSSSVYIYMVCSCGEVMCGWQFSSNFCLCCNKMLYTWWENGQMLMDFLKSPVVKGGVKFIQYTFPLAPNE